MSKQITDPEEYLDELTLAKPVAPAGAGLETTERSTYESAGDADADGAAISESTVLSFASGLSPKYRNYAQDSVRLAKLVADERYPDDAHGAEWFATYVGVLEDLGWNSPGIKTQTYRSRDSQFDVNQALVQIVASLAGGPVTQALLVEKTLEGLKSLADDEGIINLFELRSADNDKKNFQIGTARESENGSVTMALSNFSFETDQGSYKILFFRWGDDTAELTYRSTVADLNPQTYERFRVPLRQKLAQRNDDRFAQLFG